MPIEKPEFDSENTTGQSLTVQLSNEDRTVKQDVYNVGGINRAATDALAFITNTVSVLPAGVSDRYIEYFKLSGSSSMAINGSSVIKEFTIPLDATKRIFINQIRFFGGGNGIKYGQFLSKNTVLTNGIEVEVRSNELNTTFFPIKKSEDFKNLFAFPYAENFRIDIQAGQDQFIAIFNPESPIPLNPIGFNSPDADDYIKIKIRDDLSSSTIFLEAIAEGYKRDV